MMKLADRKSENYVSNMLFRKIDKKTEPMTNARKAFLSIGIAVLGIAAMWVFDFISKLESQTGRPFLDSMGDRKELWEICKEYDPLIHDLEEFRKREGKLPEDLSKLDPESMTAIRGFKNGQLHYQRNDQYYALILSLNMDGMLLYNSDIQRWLYDPGNGEASWAVGGN